LTLYIPSSVLILCCTVIVIYAVCTSKRQSVMMSQRQPCLEPADAKLGLLSSSGGPSSTNVDPGSPYPGSRARRLMVLTVLLVLGVVGWVCGAAAVMLERRTLDETVAATFYAICTSAIALLLFIAHQPTSNCFTSCWKTLSGGWQNCSKRRMTGDVGQQGPPSKQVVYSIADSAHPSFHLCTTPTEIDEVDFVTDFEQEVTGVGRRECTGSSCSIPASLSAVRLPVSSGECGECRFCRSETDTSIGNDRCLSRNSTRMKDFDELSWFSGDGNRDGCAEGGWWNGEVDVDGCSIHRAPCPSPASACSSRNYKEAGCSESSRSPSPPKVPRARHIRRWSVIGTSPSRSPRTPAPRGKDEEWTELPITRYRRRRKTARSQSRRVTSSDIRDAPVV